MSSLVERMRQNKSIGRKTANKDAKKTLNKILKDAFRLAQDDQMAFFAHNNARYVTVSLDRFNRFLKQGGSVPTTELEKRHNQNYQKVLYYMQLVDPVDYVELFQDIDYYTFPFSEMMSQYGTTSKAVREKMRKLNDKFEDFIDNSEELRELMKVNEEQDSGRLT